MDMMKKYLLDEDCYSGQIVIICEAEEVEVRHLENADQVYYLYDEPLYSYTKHIEYSVKSYYHYEDEAHREEHCLADWRVLDNKEYANQLFKDAIQFMK